LFEWFIENYASKYYLKIYKDRLEEGHGILGLEDTEFFVDALGLKFLGYVCTVLNVNGTSAREQLFYATYAARYHGLSRAGVAMMAALGLMMAMSTVDAVAKEHHDKMRNVTR
jgi:hypothetical protein